MRSDKNGGILILFILLFMFWVIMITVAIVAQSRSQSKLPKHKYGDKISIEDDFFGRECVVIKKTDTRYLCECDYHGPDGMPIYKTVPCPK